MAEAYIELLKAFGFREMQIWIATVSALLFSCCLLGGILSALAFINSNQLKQRALKDRISFRLFIIAEVLLVIFIFYYHIFMIEKINLAHSIYWISAMVMMPLLAVIGSQFMLVVFSGKVKAKAAAARRQARAERHHKQEQAKAEGKPPAAKKAAPKAPAGLTPSGPRPSSGKR